jgi:nicotinate-nucleotide pyrophosphorylase (carboxylating)
MSTDIKKADIMALMRLAIREDIGAGDITSRAIFGKHDFSKASIISKQEGIFCGGDVVRCLYEILDKNVTVISAVAEGASIKPGERVVAVAGPTASVLSGERTALNFLQRMAGIATRTSRIVALLKDTGITLLDTRKTAPGFRKLDKYAVKAGGGTNHRMGLFDMIMIKDNHIKAAGSISNAVHLVRERYGSKYTLEVEAGTLDQVKEAVYSGADIVMLDNMDISTMKTAVVLIDKKAKVEVSGNMDENKIMEIKGLSIDYISMGSLTHSVSAFDFSMMFE